MSESIIAANGRTQFRRQLLTTASGVTLLACLYGHGKAQAADDSDRPTVWIELGGQLERLTGQGQDFSAPFMFLAPTPAVYREGSPLKAEKPPLYSNGAEGTVSFQPEGSDWVFSASVRYGRANGTPNVHKEILGPFFKGFLKSVFVPGSYSVSYTNVKRVFAETVGKNDESHEIVDFQVGKDVGLGMFGRNSVSVFSLGVRFAQFTTTSNINIRAQPDFRTSAFYYGTRIKDDHKFYHHYLLTGQSARSFHAIGPSLSWQASTPLAGNPQDSEVTIDWGANTAVLFGRQRAHTGHQTNGYFNCQGPCPTDFRKFGPYLHHGTYHYSGHRSADRSVTVPNVGGFVGASFRYASAKVSFGYRGDFFFGAIDGGLDAKREGVLGFYGPFATISIGING